MIESWREFLSETWQFIWYESMNWSCGMVFLVALIGAMLLMSIHLWAGHDPDRETK
jgi:hypothetical protein